MSLRKIKKLERQRRKKDSAPARLARASKKVKDGAGNGGGSSATLRELRGGKNKKNKKNKKHVPKLEHFATYGPQNVAARALRKHKGRTLNPETSHQFTVTRAKQHMKQALSLIHI